MTQEKNTTPCNMRELLVTYLYGESTPEENLRFESHVLECAACKQELSAFESVRQSLQLWQITEAPSVRASVSESIQPKRSFLSVLKELLLVMPLWAKGLGAVATALLIFAVLGINISIGQNGFSFTADILRKNQAIAANGNTNIPGNPPSTLAKVDAAQIEELRAGLLAQVKAEIEKSDAANQDALKMQLVSLQTQLKDMRALDVLKIATQVQAHQARIRAIERDIDRREGFGLNDIFSEVTAPKSDSGSGSED
ncbi:MAG: zf-HC2 domain-containing protein [Acidobacteriota bacterium]